MNSSPSGYQGSSTTTIKIPLSIANLKITLITSAEKSSRTKSS